MNNDYEIKLVCNKFALAELIATGLEKKSTIVEIKEVEKKEDINISKFLQTNNSIDNLEKIKSEKLYFDKIRKSPKRHKKILSCWFFYKTICENFYRGQHFDRNKLYNFFRGIGVRCTSGSISAHTSRLYKMNLIMEVQSNLITKHYRLNQLVSKPKFDELFTVMAELEDLERRT